MLTHGGSEVLSDDVLDIDFILGCNPSLPAALKGHLKGAVVIVASPSWRRWPMRRRVRETTPRLQ